MTTTRGMLSKKTILGDWKRIVVEMDVFIEPRVWFCEGAPIDARGNPKWS